MGLLDQVLGQVIGGMTGQGGRSGPSPTQQGSGGGLGDLLGQVLQGGLQGGKPGPGGAAPGGLPPGPLGDLLGNVLRGGTGGPPPQPAPQAPAPAPSPSGGGLGGALGGILSGAGGKYSPLVLALLAILANKHLSSGAGGFGSVLHDMFGGGSKRQPGREPEPEGYAEEEGYGEPPDGMGGSMGGPMDDRMGGPPGDPRGYPGGYEDGPSGYGGPPPGYDDRGYGEPPPGYDQPPRGRRGRGGGDDGFLNEIGSMLDGPGSAPRRAFGDHGNDQGNGLGGLVGGGIDGLQQRFDRNGSRDIFDSWVGAGPNRQPGPADLEQAFGSDTINELAARTGLPRDELLAQLGQALPQVIDGLTPGGRMPEPDEQRRWL